MPTLPGYDAGGAGGFTVSTAGDVLSLNFDRTYTYNDTLELDLATDLGGVGLTLEGSLSGNLALTALLQFSMSLNLSSGAVNFNFDEFSFDGALSIPSAALGLSYSGITAVEGTGTASLHVGGSVFFSDGEFEFDHANNGAGGSHANDVNASIALRILGATVGSVSFADTDFFDGALSPGFDADLRAIGGVFTDAAYALLNYFAEEIDDIREEFVRTYNPEDGSIDSPGNEFLNMTIPGTDVSLERILGLGDLLKLGQYIKHYLHPYFVAHDISQTFTRDLAIPLGQPGDGETTDDYYDEDDEPSLGGFFDYLTDSWIPTLGGQAGGLTWEAIEDTTDYDGDGDTDEIVGIEVAFAQNVPFQRKVGFNFGEEAESVGLTVDGDLELNLDVSMNLELFLSFNWATDVTKFALKDLTFQGHASVDDIVVGAGIGPLQVSLGSDTGQKGVLALDLGASIRYNWNPVADVYADVGEHAGLKFTPTANTATEHNNYIDVQLPIYASLGDVTFGDVDDPPRLALAGTIFSAAGGPALAFSQENMEQLLDFSDFNLGSLIGIIQKTLDWLNDLTDADFMSYEIPLINKNLGELLDFASSFADKIQSRIDFDRINSVQDFIEQFTNAGILPAGMNVVYDAVNRTLNLPVNFDFDFSDLNLRNLANLGDFNYEKLFELAAIDPTDMFDKDTILDGMLGMLRTPLRDLARWELIDSSFFNPAKTISVTALQDLELVRPGVLPGSTILLTNLLNSDAVDVSLQDLFDTDLLSAADFATGKKIRFDDLIASQLISAADLAAAGITFYRWVNESAGTFDDVVDASDADFINLSDLLTLHSHGLSDALDMSFLSQDDFDLTGTLLDAADLVTAGLITEGALGEGVTNISLEDLLDSELVSVTLADLIGENLVGRGDLNNLAEVAAQNLSFDGFGLYDFVDLGMLTQSDIVRHQLRPSES